MDKHKADIGIIAAGAAGVAAAATLVDMGVSAIVFEKADKVGGAANVGMGPFGIESRVQKQNMITVTKEEAFNAFMDYTHWSVDAQIVRDYFWKSGDTIDWVEKMGVKFEPKKYYSGSLPTWHCVLGEDDQVHPGGGRIMCQAIWDHAAAGGAKILFSTPAERIVMKDGKAAGIVGRDKDGNEVEAEVGAVIICTGGYGANPEMIKEFTGYTWGEDLFSFSIPGMSGDGLKMAWAVGAGKSHTEIERALTYHLPGKISVQSAMRQQALMVNIQGRRICNEEIIENTAVAANVVNLQQGHKAYMIVADSVIDFVRKNGTPRVFRNGSPKGDPFATLEKELADIDGKDNSMFAFGDTVEELAQKAGIAPEELRKTVDAYNYSCDLHYDDLFCKGRRNLVKLEGRFYAAACFPGGYGTLGGIKINSMLQVITEDWEVLPGLYAAGADVCDLYNGTYMYYLPGNTMGFALNSGRLCAERAAEYLGFAK